MNFQELISRLESLDKPATEMAGGTSAGAVAVASPAKDDELDECGGMMPMGAPKQSDNVSMSLNMNGSGTGGIRDLLDILRNLDQDTGEEGDLGDLIHKMGGVDAGHKDVIIGSEIEEFANSPKATNNPDPRYAPMNRMTATGDDIHSKGDNGDHSVSISGSNAMHEQLASRLANMYEEVKARYTK
jgi:hypothetical protein